MTQQLVATQSAQLQQKSRFPETRLELSDYKVMIWTWFWRACECRTLQVISVLQALKMDDFFHQANVNNRQQRCVFYPLLGGLIAEVQGGGVPVYGNVGVSQRGSVV